MRLETFESFDPLTNPARPEERHAQESHPERGSGALLARLGTMLSSLTDRRRQRREARALRCLPTHRRRDVGLDHTDPRSEIGPRIRTPSHW